MKRRFLIISLILMLLITMAGCQQEPEHLAMSGKTPGFETLEEMEDYSGLIVRATRLEEEKPVATVSGDLFVSGYTFSSVEITEIFKDDSGEFAVGQEVTVLENQIYVESSNTVYHLNGYQMMEAGREYLLFLRKSTSGDYYISAGVTFGTVSLEDDGRTTPPTSRSGEPVGSYESYAPIWNAAIEKYT